jgi:hypothetical protein
MKPTLAMAGRGEMTVKSTPNGTTEKQAGSDLV